MLMNCIEHFWKVNYEENCTDTDPLMFEKYN